MRPSANETLMCVAEVFAARATCERNQVGCVVTDVQRLQILGVGYNGNARGLANECDNPRAVGSCGCLHAEMNALLKAPGAVQSKILYTTVSPCMACAKAIVNANVSRVYFRAMYRDQAGLDLLVRAGIRCWQLSLGGSEREYRPDEAPLPFDSLRPRPRTP